VEKISKKAKLPKICLSFGGSMPEGQFKQCPLTPPSILGPKDPVNGGLWQPRTRWTTGEDVASSIFGPVFLRTSMLDTVFPISSVSRKGCNGYTGCVYSGLFLLIDDTVPAGAGVMQVFLQC